MASPLGRAPRKSLPGENSSGIPATTACGFLSGMCMKSHTLLHRLPAIALITAGFLTSINQAPAQQAVPVLPLMEQVFQAEDARLAKLNEAARDKFHFLHTGTYISKSWFSAAGACEHPAAAAITGGPSVPLGCLLLNTRDLEPLLLPQDKFLVQEGPDDFTAVAGHDLYSFGIELEPVKDRTWLCLGLRRGKGDVFRRVRISIPAGGSFAGVWTHERFDAVEVLQPCGEVPLVYRQFFTGCHPRLPQVLSFRSVTEFIETTGARSAGNWPHTPLPMLPGFFRGTTEPVGESGLTLRRGFLSFLVVGATGEDPRFEAGDTFFRGERIAAADSAALKLLPGGWLGLTGTESFNVCTGCPVHAFGFEIVEPTQEFDKWALGTPEEHLEQSHSDKWTKFMDSTFTITLYNGSSRVGDPLIFNPEDGRLDFWGIHSPKAFTRVEIRETSGGAENELFGRFFVSDPCCCACGEKPAAK